MYKLDKKQEYSKAYKLSEEGYTNKEIIKNTLFPTWRVLEFYMKRNNLKLPFTNLPRKHKSDNRYFDKIDSFEKAYLLGIIYSDGCIYNNHRFGFCLAKQDEKLIDYIRDNICPTAIKKEINNKKGAKNRQSQITLRISNHRLVEILKDKWGVKERKTLNSGLIFPQIEEKYIWNFILGIVDGDGNIYSNKNKGYNTLRITICMTDKEFLVKLQQFLSSKGIDIKLYSRKGKTCNYYLLQTTSNKNALLFCDKLYENVKFFLDRKYQKYYKFKNLDNTELNSTITKGVESV